MKDTVKFFWQIQCPYYERQTSYGTEEIKCGNTDCPLFEVMKKEEEGE